MSKEQLPEYDFYINYDDIADYLFEELTELGYAPGTDELLDLTDIVMDYILLVLTNGGVALYVENEGEDD
jgi:hypothetical protein